MKEQMKEKEQTENKFKLKISKAVSQKQKRFLERKTFKSAKTATRFLMGSKKISKGKVEGKVVKA